MDFKPPFVGSNHRNLSDQKADLFHNHTYIGEKNYLKSIIARIAKCDIEAYSGFSCGEGG